MSANVYDEIKERGFVAQVSDEEAVRKMLGAEMVTFYVGFDSTATSLHAGSLVPIMAMVHLRRAGHRAIAVVGSGTTMVGDPSGKTEMRQMLDEATIRAQGQAILIQLARYLHFDGQGAVAVDNADWLLPLNYVAFLREIGRHFSVNRMLAAESVKIRLEAGLSFLEFNYMLLQAYDYWHLFKHYECRLQMGGNDQWGNILAGADAAQVEMMVNRSLDGRKAKCERCGQTGSTVPSASVVFRMRPTIGPAAPRGLGNVNLGAGVRDVRSTSAVAALFPRMKRSSPGTPRN